ncbi:MerR family transcriptional regulator [Micrococcus sp. FDAARGOS_333]|uniref:MerR family transcriptional regulator n=1 Tax=Micrococcus sp. FDAARGOS_333 TaxID=1930558 RepID=UPI000B4E5B0E|nr:MerR family transcriptional regulator [Micrococcus sp. FDAARGOS_333]PNL16860.1 MerR family DNA-binding transcriptional regulator [Micrococcus sp. FDAARGOS_333]
MGGRPGEARGRTMQIGEVAERVGLSLRSIRHYDDVGLVPPSARSEGGFRLYTEDDVRRLLRVKRITPLGFSLEETSRMLELLESGAVGGDPDELDGFLDRARRGRDTLARKLTQADELLAELEDLAP